MWCGQDALEEHRLICGQLKPILPVVSTKETMLEF